MYINSKDTLLDLLAAAVAVGGTYVTPKLALFTNNVSPNRNSVVGDFEITDFGGLTNLKAVVWGAAFLNNFQQAEVLGALLNWLTVSAPSPEVTAYGYIMTDTTGATYLLGERFANPVTFNAAGQNLGIIPRLVFDT